MLKSYYYSVPPTIRVWHTAYSATQADTGVRFAPRLCRGATTAVRLGCLHKQEKSGYYVSTKFYW